MKSHKTSAVRGAVWLAAILVLFSLQGQAQQGAPGTAETTDAVRELQDQVRELRAMMEEIRAENLQSRTEMRELRQELKATRALLEQPATPPGSTVAASTPSQTAGTGDIATTSTSAPASTSLDERVQKLEESTSLLGSKIDEQYQTKVETASKYRARLHGIVLMNAFRNVGGSDNLDFPDYAEPVPAGTPQASLGATFRQSEIGLELFGPTVVGARTSADIQFDFAGGFPATGNGVNFGAARLQTANVRFDWEHTSVIAGQDALFISPLSPTSFASLATPAFAFAGNLWGWTPQLRVEHRFALSGQQTITIQAGVLDNLDWEYPTDPFYRSAQAGEQSGQPAYAFRTAWSRPVEEHPLSLGVAGYYGRQNWTWDRNVDAWAGMADWQIPILPRLGLSGEFYRGRGIGGLGAAIGTSIVYGGDPNYSYTPIRGLDTAGGWTQLKFQLTPKLELNGVISEDDAFSADIRGFATDQNNFGPILGRNRGALGNFVFRPRSDLLFSA
ncbi:MAG TPA: hypothetical protein VMD76_05870, partial [Candidatus Sulfotelmatobacter sp.]|nr:hypothetical protein [Candidatus Sulfotelmatobacter sp.]